MDRPEQVSLNLGTTQKTRSRIYICVLEMDVLFLIFTDKAKGMFLKVTTWCEFEYVT
jgi:hypothetical protein